MQLARRRLVRVKGGRSPAQRTLEARQPAHTLAHGRMRRTLASGHGSQSGASIAQAATERVFEPRDQLVPETGQCSQQRLDRAEHFLAMVDRSDQARRNAGPRISIIAINPTGLCPTLDSPD